MAAPAVSAVQILLTGGTTAPPTEVIQAYIDDAAALLAGCPCILNLPDATQTAIQKYLAAHLYTVATKNQGAGAVTQKKLGDASTSYAAPSLGDGLKLTTYGQQALLYDTTGCLLTLGQKAAGFEVVTY